ncbi:MAG TPA: hypothetical protein PKG96_08310 [Bacilli bacterium]|jgi:hypothetical protein|nr:hypothetical protein [Bacilli bacterium]
MKLRNHYQFISILLLIILIGCKDDKITDPQNNAEVVVKKSNTDYNQNSFKTLFPDSSSLKSISTAYSSNYSEERKAKLIENMKANVSKLGEDVNIIESILEKVGCNVSGEYILPTYAEKAKYEDKDVWLVQFTYGLGNPEFGHFKCFAFSIPNLDTLNYFGCK